MKINKTMEGKKLSLLLASVFLFSIISQISLISSADLATTDVTLYIPQLVRNNVINGTVQVNISIADAFADQNWTRAIVYITGGGATANNSLVVLNNSPDNRNQSRNNNSLIFTTNEFIEDGNDYTLTFTLWNGTNRLNVTQANVQVNNSVPDVATSIFPTVTNTNGTLNFTATVNDSSTTTCYVNFSGTNPGSKGYVMSYAGDTCSYRLAGVPEQTYRYTITASDGNDLTTSSLQTLIVDIPTRTSYIVSSLNEGELEYDSKTDTLSVAGGGNGNSPSDLFARFINWLKSLFS